MKDTQYFEELFNAGVEQEDAKNVLRQYLNAGGQGFATVEVRYGCVLGVLAR